MAESEAFVDDNPLSPKSLALILSNLFRREDGEPMDFYIRKIRFQNQVDKKQLKEKFIELNEAIDRCGGNLDKEPASNHAVELANPEWFDDNQDIDSDIFDIEYIFRCVKQLEVLDLEPFRIGKSPYSDSINITDILKGTSSWDSVNRSISTPQKGRKLPNFGLGIKISLESDRCSPPKKKRRYEYTIKEDVAVLKFVLKHNLYDQVGGNKTWQKVAKAFPHRTYQSLQNHFRRAILPNLDKYTDLTPSERNLFRRDFSSDTVPPSVSQQQIESVSSSDELSDTSADEVDPLRITNTNVIENENDIIEATQATITTKENNNFTGIFPRVTINESPDDLELTIENLNPEDTAHPSPSTSAAAGIKSATNEGQNELDPNDTKLATADASSDASSDASTVCLSPSVNRMTRIIQPNISQSPTRILAELDQEPLELSEPESVDVESENLTSIRKKPEATRTKKPSRLYTLEEDKLMLSFICDNERYDHIQGKKIWIEMQNTILSKYKRTWESAKTRFLKTVIRDIEEYGLDEKVVKRFRAKCQTPRERYEEDKSLSSEHQESVYESCLGSGDSGSESAASKAPFRLPKNNSKLGRSYTLSEDWLIINYIIKTKRYSEVRGRALWIEIQNTPLSDYRRTWESAKNRFLKNILKNIHNYKINPEIVQKFRDGAVADRHLGGARKKRTRAILPAKHPALQESSKTPTFQYTTTDPEKAAKPSKRQLFKRHIVPLPVLFSPHPRPIAVKSTAKLMGVNIRREIDSVKEDLMQQEAHNTSLQAPSDVQPTTTRRRSKTFPPASTSRAPSPLQADCSLLLNSLNIPAPLPNIPPPALPNCSVVLKRLTKDELMKYCRQSTDSSLQPHESAVENQRFRIEFSSSFLAAKAMQKDSVKNSFFDSLQLGCNRSSTESCKHNESDDAIVFVAEMIHKVKEEVCCSSSKSPS